MATIEEELIEAELDMRERLRMDPLGVQEQFARCPGDIAYVSARHARAIGEALRAKARAKKLWALLSIQAREDLLAEVGAKGRVTEAMVEERVQTMPLWQQVHAEEIDAEVRREAARGDVAAILAKRDMLIQLGSTLRAEMQSDPVVRDRARIDRDNNG